MFLEKKHRTEKHSEYKVIDIGQLDEIEQLLGRKIPWVRAWGGSESHNPWLCGRIEIWVSPAELEHIEHRENTNGALCGVGVISAILWMILEFAFDFGWVTITAVLAFFVFFSFLVVVRADKNRPSSLTDK